jgi:PAS domain S-box-containing protein
MSIPPPAPPPPLKRAPAVAAWLAGLWAVPRGSWTRLLAGYALLFLLLQIVLGATSPLGQIQDLVGFIPVSGVTALAFWAASRAAAEPRFRRGFGCFALSFGLTPVGTIIYSWQKLGLGIDPDYSWSNLPYLLSYPFAIAGVVAFPFRRQGRWERWKLLLDGAVAVVAGSAIAWIQVVVPLAAVDPNPMHRVLSLMYPIGDLLIFAALVPLLLAPREPRQGRILQLLALGQGLYLLADMGYQLSGLTIPWLRLDWPNLPFLAGYLIMVWAAEAFYRSPVVEAGPAAAPPDVVLRNPVPLLLGLVVYLLLFREALRTGMPSHSVLALAAVVMTALILAREAVTDRQAVALGEALEARRYEERVLGIIRHLRVGVIVLGPGSELVLANQAALELLGVGEEELIGWAGFDSAWNAIHEDGSPFPAATHPVPVAIATRQPVRNVVMGVYRPRTTDRVWLLVDAEPALGPDGRVTQVLCTIHDITDRRTLEAQLRQAQRMEAVGQLAGGVAHDFNNLLTAIIGYTSMLQESLPQDAEHREEVEEIGKAAARAATLTQQLLAFGRRQMLQPVVLDIGAVVRDADRLLRRLLGEDIRIVLDLAPDLGRTRVDRGQLEQVIVNLSVNARDAMPRGGTLTITARNVAPGDPGLPAGAEVPAEGGVLLAVSDTGVGMDEATRVRAFEPFFTTKEVGKGTGLGLATVYGIVRQSGGDVWIQSLVGQGTTVSVCLPRTAAGAAGADADPAPPPAGGNNEVVLVVEDEPALVQVIGRALERQGYRVLRAEGPEAAKRALESGGPVHLLLTDVVMPGGSGPELAAWVRQRQPELPVVFISGYADEATLRYGLDLANATMLPKPFMPSRLVAVVRQALDRHG